MNEDLTPVEEQVLDALLVETLGKAAPRDFSGEILQQLHETPPEVASLVRADDRSTNRGRQRSPASTQKQIAILITAVAALAATFLIAVWLRSDDVTQGTAGTLAGNDAKDPGLQFPVSADSLTPQIDVPPRVVPDSTTPKKPPIGIPLVVNAPPGADPLMPVDDVNDATSAFSQQPLEVVTLVSQRVDSELQGYWDAIGIQPASDASREEIVSRLESVLGIRFTAEAIDDPQEIQSEMRQPDLARAIAGSWLQQITERGLSRADRVVPPDQQPNALQAGLIQDLAACFQTEQQFDRVLADWISGESPHASDFYAAMSAGPKHANDSSAMIRRLAGLTMNVDLRCTRCHDSYIEGNGRQEDYWAFAAFLNQGITRSAEGQVTVDASSGPSKPFFYELADGRQRAVEPRIAPTWMKGQSDQPIDRVAEWSERLIGSEILARGVVNSLWQLVHGQPLRGRVVDPISAPHNESLDKIEESLVQDLVHSRFDVARTLALIIASPATRREVPTALLAKNALVADDAEILAANNAVDAFAAAQPPRTQLPMNDRIDHAMRATGAKLSTDGSPIVAQIGVANGTNKSKPNSEPLAGDFPGRTQSLPVQWLGSIKDRRSQVEHLGYLAGMSEVPSEILETAEKMRSADGESTALHRVWWMVRP